MAIRSSNPRDEKASTHNFTATGSAQRFDAGEIEAMHDPRIVSERDDIVRLLAVSGIPGTVGRGEEMTEATRVLYLAPDGSAAAEQIEHEAIGTPSRISPVLELHADDDRLGTPSDDIVDAHRDQIAAHAIAGRLEVDV